MPKTRVNKQLIGGLTIAAAIVSVAAVTIVTIQNARRDPAELADKARIAEEAKEYPRAQDLYVRAFNVNKEAKYLVDASRVAYQAGELQQSMQMLNLAASQDPRNPAVLKVFLERYWELADHGIMKAAELDTYSARLLEVEPENVLALTSRAIALEQLRDQKATNAQDAADALAKALTIDPKNPRLAQLAADKILRDGVDQARVLTEKGRTDEAAKVVSTTREEAIAVLRKSIASNPQAKSYLYLGRILAAQDRLSETHDELQAALRALPNSIELRLELARALYSMRVKVGDDREQAVKLLSEALRHLDDAIRLEPAFYAAYSVRAEAQQELWKASGEWDTDRAARQKEILDRLIAALRETATLKSIMAELGRYGPRQELVVVGFDRATDFREKATDPATQAQALGYAKQFYDEARTNFSDAPFVYIMEGQLAIMDRDALAAIQAYTKAAARAGGSPVYARMAKERLALLHRQAGEPGLSLSMTDEALGLYPPNQQPRALIVNRAQLLTMLNRPKEALDYIDRLPESTRKEPDFVRARGEALAALGRTRESEQEFGRLGDDVSGMLGQVRALATGDDWPAAEAAARKALALAPENPEVLRAVYIVLLQQQKIDDARKLMAELKSRPGASEGYRRIVSIYELLLSEPDVEKRDAKLLELVEQIPDPFERLAERLNFFAMRGKVEQAAAAADELEKQRPDDERIWRMQLELAARQKLWDRAETYLGKLSAKNADRAQGSLLRGQLRLARGDADGALRDLRAAELLLPTDSDLKVQIAKALLRTKPPRFTEAADALRAAVEIDPLSFEGHKLLYLCLNDALGRQDEALPHLKQATKLNPLDDVVRKRGKILEEEEEPAKGLAWREPLRVSEPKNVENLQRLAYLYDRLGQLDKAVETLHAAAAVEPGNRAVAVLAAKVFASPERRDAGETLIRAFIQASGGLDKISAQLLLGRYFETLGDHAAAQALFTETEKRAAELAGGDDTQQKRARIAAGSELAEFFGRRDQLVQMIDTYRAVLAIAAGFPDDAARIRLRIAKALIVERQYDAAQKEISSFQKDAPQDPRGWLLEAELCIARNQYDAAAELLTRVIAAQPKHQWALFTRARVDIERRQYGRAREDLLKLKSLSPGNINPRLELARLYQLTLRYPEAETELRELAATDPDNRVFAARLIAVLKEAGKIADAQVYIAEQAARRPADAFWPYQLGALFVERRDFANAVIQYKKAVDLTNPPDPIAIERWLRTLIRAERAAEVPAIFEKLKPELMTPAVSAVAGEAYARIRQRDKAAAAFEHAMRGAVLRVDGELNTVTRQSAAAYGYADTIAIVRKLQADAKAQELSQRLRVVLARMLIEGGDQALLAEGMTLVDGLLKEAPAGTVIHIEALLALATAAERAREWELAVKHYESVLKQSPDLPAALNNLSFILADELNRAEEALPYAQRAHQLAPDQADFADTLGWVYYKLGKSDAAEAAMLDARRLAPDNLAIRYHLGLVYIQRGQKAEARRELETLTEMAKAAQDTGFMKKADDALAQLR